MLGGFVLFLLGAEAAGGGVASWRGGAGQL